MHLDSVPMKALTRNSHPSFARENKFLRFKVDFSRLLIHAPLHPGNRLVCVAHSTQDHRNYAATVIL
jgi:hypothetical protein